MLRAVLLAMVTMSPKVMGFHLVMSAAPQPALGLRDVASRLKFEVTDLDSGSFGLESKDALYGIEIVKAKVPMKPSLGLMLDELSRGRDGRGMVLVSGTAPGSNAEASGQIIAGDMVCYVGREPDRMVRVEGYDLDSTMSAIRNHAQTGEEAITLVLKRLVKRMPLSVRLRFEDENGDSVTETVEMLAGSNLRKEMMQKGFPVYDRKTTRFDQPYVTGDCAGEGICGTCLVQVINGKEFLNTPDRIEAQMTDKWQGANWRLSCRTVVGAQNKEGEVTLKLTPQKPFRK